MDANEIMAVLEMAPNHEELSQVVDRLNDDFERHLSSIETSLIMKNLFGVSVGIDFDPKHDGKSSNVNRW